MYRLGLRVTVVVAFVVFLPQAIGSNCGSNTDWMIYDPSGLINHNIGNIPCSGHGVADAQDAQVRVYDGPALIDWTDKFDTDFMGMWPSEAVLERTAPWPIGGVLVKVYCSNGGPPFHIGSSNSVTFF